MRVVCLGGRFREFTINLSTEQDVFHSTPDFRPRYVKRYETSDRSQACFTASDLSRPHAIELLNQDVNAKLIPTTAVQG